MTLQFASKILKGHGIETGPRIIFAQCREVGLLERDKPTAAAVVHGWMEQKFEHLSRNGYEADYYRPLLTWDGLYELERRLKVHHEAHEAHEAKSKSLQDLRDLHGAVSVREVDLGNGSECRLGF